MNVRDTDPPMGVAWNQALASIRVRFFRMLITTAGVALGIAFLCGMLTIRAAEPAMNKADADRQTWLVATSLLMCLVGVTNSMLMSVGERFREIGTIKCLGASDGFVVKIFVFEAALLGVIGSGAGALVGASTMSFFEFRAGGSLTTASFGSIVLTGLVCGAGLTILAAVAPAIQAARMPAAAALRVEL